jgi:hypothetical protein
MTAFPGPFNYLELLHTQTLAFVPASWDYGEYAFTNTQNRSKVVTGVRVFLSQQRGVQMYRGLPYIDIGQQKLLYQLRPLLDQTVPHQMQYSVTAFGTRPRTEYSVAVAQLA